MHLKLTLIILIFSLRASAHETVSLDSCRAMALSDNKQLRIRTENIRAAAYRHREARSAMLPAIDFAGGYTRNQKQISIFSDNQYLPVITDGKLDPASVALIPKEAMTYDIRNLFFGAVTITQPIYMGGKILAMNRITGYAEEIARELHDVEAQDIICAVDAAYWQVVSLRAKQQLAASYLSLLDTLHRNVEAMLDEGIATRSDLLSVTVRLNEANVDLTKVDNALALSRMALAQICGLPVDTPLTLADEQSDREIPPATACDTTFDPSSRPDIRALQLAIKVAEQKAVAARAEMLPHIVLIGAYSFSNPNFYDGFRQRFSGSFSIGATLTIPIWHWGGNYNRYRAALTDITVSRLELDDARERVSLQVSQARFKVAEASKTYSATLSNLDSADENLRQAQIGFSEGVLTIDNVMEAQTAWLKARSEAIDAEIDLRLCRVYLAKALGTLSY